MGRSWAGDCVYQVKIKKPVKGASLHGPNPIRVSGTRRLSRHRLSHKPHMVACA